MNRIGLMAAIGMIAAATLVLLQPADDALVVYCAHDAAYSADVLDEFTAQSGIKVAVRYDTEATKSMGLVNLLLGEKENPRCDVFWNNQVLGTVQLQSAGVLEPYKGDGWNRIPAEFKDAEGHWTGFGGRLRVIIYNTDRISVDEVDQQLTGDLSKFAFAKPIYGTTLTHFSVLWRDLSAEKFQQFHTSLKDRGAMVVAGNSATKNLVANGSCDFAWTDTDDYFVAVDAGKPVGVLPVRTPDGSTICIPNSVAIIKGSKRIRDAQKLVDFLLSEENELRLANSRARQIPLGEIAGDAQLPQAVRDMSVWAADGIQYTPELLTAQPQCLEWLSAEYLQ